MKYEKTASQLTRSRTRYFISGSFASFSLGPSACFKNSIFFLLAKKYAVSGVNRQMVSLNWYPNSQTYTNECEKYNAIKCLKRNIKWRYYLWTEIIKKNFTWSDIDLLYTVSSSAPSGTMIQSTFVSASSCWKSGRCEKKKRNQNIIWHRFVILFRQKYWILLAIVFVHVKLSIVQFKSIHNFYLPTII